jgi:hypothetical protein
MLNTFDNADAFHKRRLERERHMANMDIFSRAVEHDDEDAVLSMVDALSGFPLAKQDEQPKVKSATKPPRFYVLCFVVIVVLAVVSILSAWAGMIFEKNSIVPGEVDPFVAKSSNARFQKLFSLVLDWGLTPRSKLEDESSPSRKALNWLVEVDTGTENAEDIRTRYALASLYFGTQNASDGFVWAKSIHWLSEFPVCLWYGVYCHEDEWITVGRVGALNLSSNGKTW